MAPYATADHCGHQWTVAYIEVRKKAKIRNRYNQIPHLTKDTIWEKKTPDTRLRAKRSALSQSCKSLTNGSCMKHFSSNSCPTNIDP